MTALLRYKTIHSVRARMREITSNVRESVR